MSLYWKVCWLFCQMVCLLVDQSVLTRGLRTLTNLILWLISQFICLLNSGCQPKISLFVQPQICSAKIHSSTHVCLVFYCHKKEKGQIFTPVKLTTNLSTKVLIAPYKLCKYNIILLNRIQVKIHYTNQLTIKLYHPPILLMFNTKEI